MAALLCRTIFKMIHDVGDDWQIVFHSTPAPHVVTGLASHLTKFLRLLALRLCKRAATF
jgi:hypothetical protein